jgi:hypothetical protein
MMKNKILDLIAKFEFWYAVKRIKLDEHYTFFFDLAGEPGTFAVKLLRKYDGVIVEYSNIRVDKDNQLNFDVDVVSNVNNCDTKSKAFNRFTSNIMRSIIHNSIETAERGKNENGNTDLVESDSERTIHEEVSAVSEKRVPERKPRKKTVRRNKAVHSQVQQSAADSSTGD